MNRNTDPPKAIVRRRHPYKDPYPIFCLRNRILPDLLEEAYWDWLCQQNCTLPTASIKSGKCICDEERAEMIKRMNALWSPTVVFDGQEGKPNMIPYTPTVTWRPPNITKGHPVGSNMSCYCAAVEPNRWGSAQFGNYYATCPYYNPYYNCC